jgi:hypothetical protein
MKRFASVLVALAVVVLLPSCSLIPGSLFGKSDTVVSNERAVEIVDAINARDAATLKSMFTKYARTEFSAEIDDGLEYLLSLFPDGDVVLVPDTTTFPSVGESVHKGKKAKLVGKPYLVRSGGNDYSLYFDEFQVNTIDPDNVGIYRMGAFLRTDSDDSSLELAFHSWAGSLDVDAPAGGPPGVFVGDSGGLSRDRAAQIVEALNTHDAAALKAMFTDHARTEYSAQIDDGLEYLLSLFPDGDVVLGADQGGSAVQERIDGDHRTVMLTSFYTVSSGGVDYRLFFADFTENTTDPANTGVYAIGAGPTAETRLDVPEVHLFHWSIPFYIGASTAPGVFIPEPE